MKRRYSQLCGVATALDMIGDRWALLILRDLLLGPMRFSEFTTSLPGIGSNTLTSRLKALETAGVVQRRLLALPEGGTAYELTEYGRELEPILLALGRWGGKRMGSGLGEMVTNSRWFAAALLAYRNERQEVDPATTWELRLSDGPFTVRGEGTQLTVTAGAPESADLIVSAADRDMYMLLAGQVKPSEAIESGAVTLSGDEEALERLVSVFVFPTPAALGVQTSSP